MAEARLSSGNRIEPSQVRAGYPLASIMMKREIIPIADVYVPIKRRATLEQKRVDEIAASILDKGLQAPILVRADGARFVLVEGLHRLEAAKALGEQTIVASLWMRGSTERPSVALAGMPHSRHASDLSDRAKHGDTRSEEAKALLEELLVWRPAERD
jgi:sulfiredoxin